MLNNHTHARFELLLLYSSKYTVALTLTAQMCADSIHPGSKAKPNNPGLCLHQGETYSMRCFTWAWCTALELSGASREPAMQGAIVTMTKCLAKQLIGSRGIRVNAGALKLAS